jgi:hypothetical protein
VDLIWHKILRVKKAEPKLRSVLWKMNIYLICFHCCAI